MARLNVILLVIALICALGVVAAQHKARKLFQELEREQERMAQLQVEWDQLQAEQGMLSAHGRIERIARERLVMRPPAAGRLIAVEPPANAH